MLSVGDAVFAPTAAPKDDGEELRCFIIYHQPPNINHHPMNHWRTPSACYTLLLSLLSVNTYMNIVPSHNHLAMVFGSHLCFLSYSHKYRYDRAMIVSCKMLLPPLPHLLQQHDYYNWVCDQWTTDWTVFGYFLYVCFAFEWLLCNASGFIWN